MCTHCPCLHTLPAMCAWEKQQFCRGCAGSDDVGSLCRGIRRLQTVLQKCTTSVSDKFGLFAETLVNQKALLAIAGLVGHCSVVLNIQCGTKL